MTHIDERKFFNVGDTICFIRSKYFLGSMNLEKFRYLLKGIDTAKEGVVTKADIRYDDIGQNSEIIVAIEKYTIECSDGSIFNYPDINNYTLYKTRKDLLISALEKFQKYRDETLKELKDMSRKFNRLLEEVS